MKNTTLVFITFVFLFYTSCTTNTKDQPPQNISKQGDSLSLRVSSYEDKELFILSSLNGLNLNADVEKGTESILFVYNKYDCSDCVNRVYEAFSKINKQLKSSSRNGNQKCRIYAVDISKEQEKKYQKYELNTIVLTENNAFAQKMRNFPSPLIICIGKDGKAVYVSIIDKPFPKDYSDIKRAIGTFAMEELDGLF